MAWDREKDFEEVLNASLVVAKGEHSAWKPHASAVLKKHGKRSLYEVVEWVTTLMLRAAEHYNLPAERLSGETVPFYLAVYMWARDGFPHFSLTSDFFDAVAVTDFGDPTDEPLYMPFDSFTLSFPKSELFGQANRIFVYKIPTIFVVSGKLDVRWKLYRATLFQADPIFTQWPVGFTRKQLVDEANTLDMPANSPGMRPLDPGEENATGKVRSLISNVMTYVESCGPLPTEQNDRKKTVLPVERVHTNPVFDVGRTVKLDGRLRQAMRSGGGHASWKLAQRFIVRGHWKGVPYGPSRSLRRRQWVAPYWKGPDNVVEALSRTYEVGNAIKG